MSLHRQLTSQDYAMVCLLDTFEVVCFHHDTSFKIRSVIAPNIAVWPG